MAACLQSIAFALLVLGAGFLRTLPSVPGVPRVVNHPLGLALLLAFVVWVATRSDGRRLAGLPVLAALLCEGWVRIAFLNPAFEGWLAPRLGERVADAAYHLLGAAWLILIVVSFSRAAGFRLATVLATRHWKRGLYLHTLSLLFVYGLLSVLLQAVEGFRGLSLHVPIYPPPALWALAGQTALCLGEEIFYRGLLATGLSAALARGGSPAPGHQALGLVLSSLLFALDHGRGLPWGLPLVMTALYTLLLGLLLGWIVRLTGHLALATLAHLFHNLMILRLGLSVSDPGGAISFEAMTYISLYFILTFSILFVIRRPAWEPLRRALADPA